MKPEQSEPATRVVLTPELVGRSLVQQDCLAVLQTWRDRKMILVVNRPLLLSYLKLLKSLGVPVEQNRRWLWWFTSSEKVVYSETQTEENQSGFQLCQSLQQNSNAEMIVCSNEYFQTFNETLDNWVPVSRFQLLPAL
ncbi:MAG TPA: hypothetical protein EYQ50_26405 [Verrucomicrobiales bacterium]|nr:hypothetical protein [Verrucomicrobiales bacterium]